MIGTRILNEHMKFGLALVIAGMSLFGSVSSAVITVRLAETSDPPPSETCIQILGDYNDQIAAHPTQK